MASVRFADKSPPPVNGAVVLIVRAVGVSDAAVICAATPAGDRLRRRITKAVSASYRLASSDGVCASASIAAANEIINSTNLAANLPV